MPASEILVDDLVAFLDRFAPSSLAEDWDNVGLLIGDRMSRVTNVMTCLTVTEDVAAEAEASGVQLIVSHHPVLFRAVRRLTTETAEGRMLLTLMRAGAAVYSPHTAFDSAFGGINQMLAESLGLSDIVPLRPASDSESFVGGGRAGTLPQPESLEEFIQRVRRVLSINVIAAVGDSQKMVQRVAVACGAAAEFLADAKSRGCDVLVTGEARFHACLEARAMEIGLILAGHYATERPAVEWLARKLAEEFPSLHIWASRVETDPVRWSVS